MLYLQNLTGDVCVLLILLIIIHIFTVIQGVSVGWEVDITVSVTPSIDDSGTLGVVKCTQLFH